jgi:hypothetical protein
MKRVKKWAKKAILHLIDYARERPAIKAWTLGRLRRFPALESRLRRLSGSSLIALAETLPLAAPAARSQLSPRARQIHDDLVAAIAGRAERNR